MKPNPILLDSLRTSRFLSVRSQASMGMGERRSNSKGSGLEFAEHRPYRAGDDIRHLDPRLYARFGENYLRQYFVDRQLPVYVLLDGTTSMAASPEKYAIAAELAQTLAYVGLSSGDRVQMGIGTKGGLKWSPSVQGASRAQILFSWLEGIEPKGAEDFGGFIREATRNISKKSYVVIISDFWDEGVMAALGQLEERECDVFALQVCSPEEIDPSVISDGAIRFQDSESLEDLEIVLDSETVARYQDEVKNLQERYRERLIKAGGRFISTTTGLDVKSFFLHDLRVAGVIS